MQQDQLTNHTNIPLSIAAWMAYDGYDHVADPNYLSVTTLIKSPRQIILGMRAQPKDTGPVDVSSFMHSTIGTAVHNSIENVWLNHYAACLARLNYPDKIIKRIRINPEPAQVTPDTIPIYMEQRAFREVSTFTIGGKLDFVGNGVLDDFKTTGVYSYISGSNEWKYMMQGSLYRWLNPEMITSDHMNIQFIFTDWSRKDSFIQAKKGYPPTKIHQHKVKLLSVPETDVWVTQRVALLESLLDAPEADLPLCKADVLWQDAPTFKYYKNPEKTEGRSTKNFDTSAEAQIKWIEDGRVGTIIEVPGETKGCLYCDVFNLCSQKDSLIACGSLKIREE